MISGCRDAWHRLEGMSEHEAMRKYIDGLRELIEQMSQTNDMEQWMDQAGPMFEVVGVNGGSIVSKRLDLGSSKLPNGTLPESNYDSERSATPVDSGYHDSIASAAAYKGPSPPNGSLADIEQPQSDDDAFTDAPDFIRPLIDTPRKNSDKTRRGKRSHRVHSGDKRSSRKETPPTDRLLSLNDDLNELNEAGADENIDELYQVSWDAIERAQRDRKLRESQQMQDQWMLFETGMLNRPRVRAHRGRNGEEKRDAAANGASTDGEQSHGDDESAGTGQGDHVDGRRGRSRLERERRETSSSSSGGGSVESPGLSWDPQVAAVLFRMHREMQHIGRQLDMLENVLVSQQRLLRASLTQSFNANRSRLWFFKNMPWRTIIFILAWPFFANFLVRFIYRRIARNGPKLPLRAKIL
uniref:ACB domain-containing protein n=1 Tax=Plectus sambesii TaxID=2011161 RepID=A0A914W7K7_9BILA